MNTMTQTNKQIIEDFLDLINRQRKVREAFDRYVGDEYIQHNPTGANGKDAAVETVSRYVNTPGFRASVNRILADGEFVAVHMEVQFEEPIPGIAVMDMWRLKDGKLVEHWDVIQEIPKTTVSGNSMF